MPVTQATLEAIADDRAANDTRIDQATRDLTAAWATSWTAQNGQLAGVLAGLVAAAAGAWPTRREISGSFRLQIAFAGLQMSFARLAARAVDLVGVAAEDAARSSAASQAAMIVAQLPDGVTLAPGVASLTDDQITEIVRRAKKAAEATLKVMPGQVTDAIRAELIRGRRAEDPNRAVEQVLAASQQHSNAAFARALLVVRTEIMDAHRAAAQAVQETAVDILVGWMWVCKEDPTVCGACWALHGTVHPISQTGPYDHPAGRCVRAPIIKPWSELGLPGTENDDLTPDAEAVFWSLSRADQLKIMGPGRLHLLDTGQVEWADLVRLRDNPGWRPSIGLVPLKDLT